MTQSRLESAVETTLNIGSGFLISWAMWAWVIAPLYGLAASGGQSFGIVCIFTVTSVVRSYFWRRLFNRRTHVE